MKLKYLLGISAFALGAAALTSCDDDTYDVVGNPDNLVFVNIAHDYPANMPKNTYAYTIYQTPIGPLVSSTPGTVELYVQSTKNAPADINVTFELAPDAEVAGYDKFPENSGLNVTLTENTVTIPAGSNRSNTVVATIDDSNADWSKFDGKAYLLPIRITNVTGGAVASVEMNYAYIGVNVDHKSGMVNPDANSIDGTPITDIEGWTAYVKCPGAGEEFDCTENLFDDSRWAESFFFKNHADKVHEEVTLDIDFGKVINVSGFRFQYYYMWYTIQDGTIYTSVDGVEYTDQGTRTFSNNSYERYFAFWGPTPARYVRVITHSYYDGTGEGTALDNVYVYE